MMNGSLRLRGMFSSFEEAGVWVLASWDWGGRRSARLLAEDQRLSTYVLGQVSNRGWMRRVARYFGQL